MKKTSMRLLIVVSLMALVACSWYMLLDNTKKDQQQYADLLGKARTAVSEKLYMDALDYYKETMEYRDSIELRDEVAQLYLDHFTKSNYEAFCEMIIEDYPYEKIGYERLATYYRDSKAFYTCFDIIESAGKRGVQSEVLDALVQELYYAYELREKSFVYVSEYSSGYCAVQRESGKWGFANNNGDTVIAGQYLDATAFSSTGVAAVLREDGVYVLVNINNREKCVAPDGLEIEACMPLISGKMAVKYNGKYHYCNEKFQELFGEFDYAGTFYCGVAAVQNGEKWAIINEKGEQVTDFIYDDVKLDSKGIAFRGNRALVKQNGKYCLIDTKGQQVGSETWEDADAFNADLVAAVCKDGKWGFVNTEGEVVVPYQYFEAKSFSNGFAAVRTGAKWGFIDAEKHELVIEAAFDEVRDFAAKGNVFVKVGDRWNILRIYRMK